MKYAVALEGGAAKGAYHAGVFKALDELGVEINCVVGSSVGALNAALYIQSGSEKMIELWSNATSNLVVKTELVEYNNYLSSGEIKDFKTFFNDFKNTVKKGGISVDRLKETISENINEEDIRNSNIDFGISTFNVSDMKPFEVMISKIPKGMLIEYMVASCYLPVFKMEKIDGKYFVDGGFHNSLPVSVLLENGYKDIIAVEILKYKIVNKLEWKKYTQKEITTIRPSEEIGTMHDFKRETLDKSIELGYLDTLKTLSDISGVRGYNYFIKNMIDDNEAFRYFYNIKEEDILEIKEMMHSYEFDSKRLLFEIIIPEIAELLDVKKSSSYSDIILRFMEYLAEILNIERLKLYDFYEFKDIIFKKIDSVDDDNSSFEDMVSMFFKEKSLMLNSIKRNLIIKIAKSLKEEE